jgi:hypothetical protein
MLGSLLKRLLKYMGSGHIGKHLFSLASDVQMILITEPFLLACPALSALLQVLKRDVNP